MLIYSLILIAITLHLAARRVVLTLRQIPDCNEGFDAFSLQKPL